MKWGKGLWPKKRKDPEDRRSTYRGSRRRVDIDFYACRPGSHDRACAPLGESGDECNCGCTAYDVFCGQALLDHLENWAPLPGEESK